NVLLKDNVTLAEIDLTDGVTVYAFGPAETSADRFNIHFRSPAAATNLEKASKEYLMVYSNTSKQLTIIMDEALQNGSLVSVYNSIGQKLLATPATGACTRIQQPFTAGVYFVTVQCASRQSTKKVVIF
ncbi:MAG: T9SS type A sorting domain-containing protein, partial [Bacteroidia bacterium]|nr:T9SS type A sorting domain-containing protein [Bacteroidia bacterium]